MNVSTRLQRNGFAWDDCAGQAGGWVRREPDGTTTKLARIGRLYVAVSMLEIQPRCIHSATCGCVVYRQAESRTRDGALRGLWAPNAAALADSIYRGAGQ